MTIGGSEREIFDFALSVNHAIDRSRFANSLYLTPTRKRERIVTVSVTVTPDTAEALYAATLPAITERAFVSRFLNPAGKYVEFDCGALVFAWQPQPKPRRGESLVSIVGTAVMTDSTGALTVKLKP
jgi:hypothetical protein